MAPAVGLSVVEGFWAIGMFGLFLYMLGLTLFGVVTYMTRVFARVAAALIVAGGASGTLVFGWVMGTGGEQVTQWVGLLCMLVMALGWISIGLDAIRRDRSTFATGPAAA